MPHKSSKVTQERSLEFILAALIVTYQTKQEVMALQAVIVNYSYGEHKCLITPSQGLFPRYSDNRRKALGLIYE